MIKDNDMKDQMENLYMTESGKYFLTYSVIKNVINDNFIIYFIKFSI